MSSNWQRLQSVRRHPDFFQKSIKFINTWKIKMIHKPGKTPENHGFFMNNNCLMIKENNGHQTTC